MGSLTKEQVRHFEDHGFLVVRELFDPAVDFDPIIEEYNGVLDRLIDRLYAAGEIASRYEEWDFGRRLIQIHTETGKSLVQHFDFSLPPSAKIGDDVPIWLGPAVFKALSNEALLDAVESLIGPEIFVSPIHHVRLKLPESSIPAHLRQDGQLRTTLWHQDNGVVLPEADQTEMITVWYPLGDAPISAGPIRLVPGFHRNGLVTHCQANGGGVRITPQVFEDQPQLSLPLKRGDVLLMHRLMPHSALPNTSDNVRWSFDLRYHPVGQPTGRENYPGFVGRSRSAPQTELHDADQWRQSWLQARAQMVGQSGQQKFNRWLAEGPLCA